MVKERDAVIDELRSAVTQQMNSVTRGSDDPPHHYQLQQHYQQIITQLNARNEVTLHLL